jgi:hypothetical protein
MPFVWSIGTVIGPAIGGTFSNPAINFPNAFSPDGVADAIKTPAVDLRAETYGTFEGSDDSQWRNTHTKFGTPKIFTKRVISLIIAMGLFTYHSMTYDHLLPIFLEDKRGETFSAFFQSINPFSASGGLGLTVQNVGIIMAIDGVIALFIQAIIFPFAAEKVGIYRLFILVSLCHPVSYIIMPYLVYLPPSLLYPGIYFCLTIRNLLSILAYPVLLIMIKEASPSPSVLGKINGLAASAGAACRTVAPPIAGYLYGIGSKMDFTALAWYGSAFVAVIGAIQCFSIKREKRRLSEEDFDEHKRDLSSELDKNLPVVLITEVDE